MPMCLQPVSGYNYRCIKCNFFLHLSCLQLPMEALHPLHQAHPLVLLQDPPSQEGLNSICQDCSCLSSSGFTYNCATCQYNLHLQCATRERQMELEIHKHPLTFSTTSPTGGNLFLCNVCGENGQSFNLNCKGCRFVIHIECSTLPLTAMGRYEEHEFKLTPTLSIEGNEEEAYCDICEEEANLKGCLYYCEKCKYGSHLGCVISMRKPHLKLSYKDADPSAIAALSEAMVQLNLGVLNEQFEAKATLCDDEGLIALRRHYLEDHMEELGLSHGSHSQSDDDFQRVVSPLINFPKLDHFTHAHPLILSNLQKNGKFDCFGCSRQISGLAYGCSQCQFFLHRWCAELPQNIKHPLHPSHSLTLSKSAPPMSFGCEACEEPCDGFTFTYSCQSCRFCIHSECASVPVTLRSEVHDHHLMLRQRPYSATCVCCSSSCTGATFHCEECNWDIDFNCALLPHTVKHKHHLHPFTLKYSHVEDDSGEYYCDFCEELRDPKNWVYYCADCDFVAHINCLTSELFDYGGTKGLQNYDHHTHLLNIIMKSPLKSSSSSV